MEKRFRSTDLCKEKWYRKLKPAFKNVWDFICDNCDKAGMWSVDDEALEFFIGEEIDFNSFMVAVNADCDPNDLRVEWYNNGLDKVWVPGFTDFQYGELSSACVPHKKIIELLNKYGLLHRVPVRVHDSVLDRVHGTHKERKGKEEDKDREEEKEEEGKTEKSKPNRQPNILPKNEQDTDLKTEYKTQILPKLDNMPEVDQKLILAGFIRDKKPGFIEPYTDLWNLSAIGNQLATVKTISDSRVRKFKLRVKEPAFNFLKVLEEIKLSNYLRGKINGWKVDFDWVFENDSNYVSIIEGKYRNTQN
jgi:hypothetical protein